MQFCLDKKLGIAKPSPRKFSLDMVKSGMSKIIYQGQKVALIGICGGQASGKTQISQYFKKNIKRSDVLSESSFFIPGEKERNLSQEEQKLLRDFEPYSKDRRKYLIDITDPKSYDYEKFYKTLMDLIEGKKVTVPTFNEKELAFSENDRVIDPSASPLIIIDGYFIFKDKKINDLLNLKIYKEVEDDLRLIRLTLREEEYLKTNYESYELFFSIYEHFFKRSFDENIVIYKKNANILLPDYSVDEVNFELQADDTLKLLVNSLNHLNKEEKKEKQKDKTEETEEKK